MFRACTEALIGFCLVVNKKGGDGHPFSLSSPLQ